MMWHSSDTFALGMNVSGSRWKEDVNSTWTCDGVVMVIGGWTSLGL
jgi:hypothetical protein